MCAKVLHNLEHLRRKRPILDGSQIEGSRGVGYFLVRNIRACLCLHIVGREEVKGLWDEAFDGKARQALEGGYGSLGVLELSVTNGILERCQSRSLHTRD